MAARESLSRGQFSWSDDGLHGSTLDERYAFEPEGNDRRRQAGLVEHGVDIRPANGRYEVEVGSNQGAFDRDNNYVGRDRSITVANGRTGGYRTLMRAQVAGAGIAGRTAKSVAEERPEWWG